MQEAVLCQQTATTIGQACGIEHAHSAIVLGAACFGIEEVIGWAAQRSIRLELEVCPSKLACPSRLRELGRPVVFVNDIGDQFPMKKGTDLS